VGDRVRFKIASLQVRGHVVEDRGDLGIGGRQLVAVRADNLEDVDETQRFFVVPAERVTVIPKRKPRAARTG